MNESIHKEMTREAIGERVSLRMLEIVIAANIKQDSPRGLIGHDEYHFDNNAFDKSYRYINEQRGYILASLMSPGVLASWVAFGRLTHAVQDFYSHTNYVSLWLDSHSKNGTHPSSTEIDPQQKELIDSPNLYSAKVYLPMDALYLIPFMRRFAIPLLPEDSHGRMNLDSPEQGPRFEYARAAAVKRTIHEFELLEKILTPEMFARFTDL